MDSGYCIVLTTAGDIMTAEKIANVMLEFSLVACVQIDKVHSFFKWNSKIETQDEFRLTMKAPSANYETIENEILKIHTYTLPQILKLDISDGYDPYLKWLTSSCS